MVLNKNNTLLYANLMTNFNTYLKILIKKHNQAKEAIFFSVKIIFKKLVINQSLNSKNKNSVPDYFIHNTITYENKLNIANTLNNYLLEPLTLIINQSLMTGVFPDNLKLQKSKP